MLSDCHAVCWQGPYSVRGKRPSQARSPIDILPGIHLCHHCLVHAGPAKRSHCQAAQQAFVCSQSDRCASCTCFSRAHNEGGSADVLTVIPCPCRHIPFPSTCFPGQLQLWCGIFCDTIDSVSSSTSKCNTQSIHSSAWPADRWWSGRKLWDRIETGCLDLARLSAGGRIACHSSP